MDSTITEDFDIGITNEKIIRLCEDAQFSLGGESGWHVARIARNAVAKWGMYVTKDEATIQDFVQRHADARVLKVPEVFRFFETVDGYRRQGYLVMEYIDGKHINKADQHDIWPVLCHAIKHLWSIPIPPDLSPGPFTGGKPKGYLWSDDGSPRSFRTLHEMEAFMNWCIRLSTPTGKLTLAGSPLVICHTDLAARNILRIPGGRICILDWEFAGVYPKIFEIYSLAARTAWEPHFKDVLRGLDFPNAGMDPQIQLLDQVCCRLTRYHIPQYIPEIDDYVSVTEDDKALGICEVFL